MKRLSLFSALLIACFAMMMTGCIIAEETTEVRFLNDAATNYDVRLRPVSGGGDVMFTAIEPEKVSQRKTITPGDYYVYAKESGKSDVLNNWTITPRTYSYGELTRKPSLGTAQ